LKFVALPLLSPMAMVDPVVSLFWVA